MKDIKDYLHLYVGCLCEIGSEDDKKTRVLTGVDYGLGVHEGVFGFQKCAVELVKPILRPLSDMTGGERIAAYDLHFHKNMNVDKIAPTTKVNTLTLWMKDGFEHFTPDTTRYLLAKSFDIFGLIEAGLAIDKTAVPTP